MIIHDTDDEDEEPVSEPEDVEKPEHDNKSEREPEPEPEPAPAPALRTRKAKEQTRLGVGRPVVAGGSGARAVTKSLSINKSKRGKSSKSMKLTEATIPEEGVSLRLPPSVLSHLCCRRRTRASTVNHTPNT